VESDVVRWRNLDVHGKRTFLEHDLPRIRCAEHGKITASVPWARHDDRFSRPFEEFAVWKAATTAWTWAAAELRISWEGLASWPALLWRPPGRGCSSAARVRVVGRCSPKLPSLDNGAKAFAAPPVGHTGR
jgi:transposase